MWIHLIHSDSHLCLGSLSSVDGNSNKTVSYYRGPLVIELCNECCRLSMWTQFGKNPINGCSGVSAVSAFCSVVCYKYKPLQLTFRNAVNTVLPIMLTIHFSRCVLYLSMVTDGGGAAPVSVRSGSGSGHQLPSGDARTLRLLRHPGTAQCSRSKY